MNLLKKVIPVLLIVCLFTACGSANTRYVTDSSANTEKIQVTQISYNDFWIQKSTSITSKINNVFIQMTKIKDAVQLAEEHKRAIPELVQEVQDYIDTSSQLNLGANELIENQKRIEEGKENGRKLL